ncbi:MAG TPA: lactate racemase domain-containing protein [Pirellulales bacterium]|nr:lactate racemase domain-containing protein [Pirellulales bacterium]
MSCVLPYGSAASLALDLSSEALVAHCAAPHGEGLRDVAEAVASALAEPLEFPALSRATVPGDRIVLAVESELPQTAELVAAVARYLVETGTAPESLTVLRPDSVASQAEGDPRRLLPADWRHRVACEVHDPSDTARLAHLGSTRGGEGVYLNRTLLDADLVVPMGCLRCEPALGFHGRHGGVYPTFSNAKALGRFRKPHAAEHQCEFEARARREIDEVGWMLGALCTVQVVPGAGEALLAVLAGEVRRVFDLGQEHCLAAWSYTVPRRASLVVAAISGGPGQQTWNNVGRALSAASRAATEGGAVVLCTELASEPGPAVRSLAQAEDLADTERQIRRACPPDALAAVELARIMDRAKVYLLSQLDESLVADLGMAPVSAGAEVARLARRHASCTVLASAQHARVTPWEDT